MIPDTLKPLIVPIDQLHPYPDNPRQGDIGAIVQSLEHHGQFRPLVVNKPTMQVLAGNHTLAAATQLGWTEIAVTFVDVDDEEARRIVLVDNRTNDLAAYDDRGLADLLTELASTDAGLAGTGFDGDDLEQLLADLDSSLQFNRGREGETPAPPENPTTQIGDMWQLGDHRLFCGDALTLIEEIHPDAAITDPPYGINLDTDFSKMAGKEGLFGSPDLIRGNRYRPVLGDDQDFDPSPFLDAWSDVNEQFWFGPDYYWCRLPPGGLFVWDKRLDDSGDRRFGSTFELIWSKQRHKRDTIRVMWSGVFGLTTQDTRRRIHPTQKPVQVIEWLIDRYTQPGNLIVDPFAGSGTTLIACENTGRRCYAIEIDPGYVDVIMDRYRSINPDATIQRIESLS